MIYATYNKMTDKPISQVMLECANEITGLLCNQDINVKKLYENNNFQEQFNEYADRMIRAAYNDHITDFGIWSEYIKEYIHENPYQA